MKVWSKVVRFVAGLALMTTVAGAQKVTLNFWTQGAGGDGAAYEKIIADFQKDYPNIEVKVQLFAPDAYNNAINLAFRSGNPPDIFRSAINLPLATQVANGWLLPLDRFVTSQLLLSFPSGSLAAMRVGGQLYSLPFIGAAGHTNYLFYNKKIFAEAGLSAPPRTFAELRDFAKKITAAGKGQYYGFALHGGQGNATPLTLANVSGFPGDLIQGRNHVTGRANVDHPAVVAAVDLLKAMNLEDKSFLPGWEALNIRQMADTFVAGKVGMFQGNWSAKGNIEQAGFKAEDYGIAPLPTPDGRITHKVPVGALQHFHSISARTRHPREAWLFFNYLHSAQGVPKQIALGLQPSVPAVKIPVAELAKVSYGTAELVKIMNTQVITGPDPLVRNPEWAAVQANFKYSNPTLFNLFTAAIAGKVDYTAEARKFNADYDRLMDEAIEAARKDGARVCRELLEFPNFTTTRPYAAQNYASLPKCP